MINSVPDLPKDFTKAEKVLKYGNTIMGIFNLNGGRLKTAYVCRRWLESGFFFYQTSQLCCFVNPMHTISNILEGMTALIQQKVQGTDQMIYALVVGRAFALRLFVEGKIVDNVLLPTKTNLFEGQVYIGDNVYKLFAEEAETILSSDFQIAFVDQEFQIIGQP